MIGSPMAITWLTTGVIYFTSMEGKTFYYKIAIGRNEDMELLTSLKFKRLAYIHPKFPNLVLVEYVGDCNVAIDFPHGNANKEKALNRPFKQTTKSLRTKMKNSTGYPSNTYHTLVRQAQSEVRKHIVDAPRDMKQVENAKWNERQRKRLSNDEFINLKEIGYESNFVRQLVIHEEVRIIGFCEGLLETLKTLIGRSDLPTQVLSCDTTFNLGLFYGTFVIFRRTEFLESHALILHAS